MFYKQGGLSFTTVNGILKQEKGDETHGTWCMGRTNVSITDQYVVHVNDNCRSLTCWKMPCQV